jgi:hypothetical protein
MTCEQYPLPSGLTDPTRFNKVQEKYACLISSATTAESMPDNPIFGRDRRLGQELRNELDRVLSRKKMLLYELWGNELTDTQRMDARGLYSRGAPTLSCGPDDSFPGDIPDLCMKNTKTVLFRDPLKRCIRLTGSHVSPALASRELVGCIDLLEALVQYRKDAQQEEDLKCRGDILRSKAQSSITELTTKQLDVRDADIDSLGALGRQLYLLDRWHRASTANALTPGLPFNSEYTEEPENVAREFSAIRGSFWKKLQAKPYDVYGELSTSLAGSPDTAAVETALGIAEERGRAADQAVVRALFTPIETLSPDAPQVGRLPMTGVPLLGMLGDALAALNSRANDMTSFHDFACLFRPCGATRADTPVASTVRILGNLADGAALATAVAAAPGLQGWREAFQRVSSQHEALAQALRASGCFDGDPSKVAASALPLGQIMRHSTNLHKSYTSTGTFDPTAHKSIAAGLNDQDKERVATYMLGQLGAVETAVTTYHETVVALASSLLNEAELAASTERSRNYQLQRAVRYDQLASDLAGLRVSAAQDEKRFSDMAAAYGRIESSIDKGQYFAVRDTTVFEVSGLHAKFSSAKRSVSDLTVIKVADLRRGQMLNIQAEGTYSPTCSRRSLSLLGPEGGEPISMASAANAEIGPEGFSLQWTNGQYRAVSASQARTTSQSDTESYEVNVCAVSSILGTSGISSFGYSGKGCYDSTRSKTYSISDTTSDTTGTEKRTSASFNAGLRLSNTPFPNLPAGSLLVVLVYPGPEKIIHDVRVVQSPTTQLMISSDVDAYFVVNDMDCADKKSNPKLTVSYRTMTSVGEAASQMVEAMSAPWGEDPQDLRSLRLVSPPNRTRRNFVQAIGLSFERF